jgi:hypothetical protein
MRIVSGLAILACAATAAVPSPGLAKNKTPPAQIDAWAACAVERNAGDVAWLYIVESNQSGLQGRALDSAFANGFGGVTRDCVPEGAGFWDNDGIKALMTKAYSLWKGDLTRTSSPRPVDAWADCIAKAHPEKARAYLFARDMAFAGGPKIIVENVDPVQAVSEPSAECDALRPGAMPVRDSQDLYARFNYLMRVKPRLATAPAAAVTPAAAAGDKH